MTAPTEETQLEILKQLKRLNKYQRVNFTDANSPIQDNE